MVRRSTSLEKQLTLILDHAVFMGRGRLRCIRCTEANVRILLVDDHDESRELTEAALNSAGFIEVATAASAWDALNILDIWRADRGPTVDLILLDIVMPKMNGIETCAR